jgi:hypothetical protein
VKCSGYSFVFKTKSVFVVGKLSGKIKALSLPVDFPAYGSTSIQPLFFIIILLLFFIIFKLFLIINFILLYLIFKFKLNLSFYYFY